MKKFTALSLALVLVLSLSAASFAESGKTEYIWEDVAGPAYASFAHESHFWIISEVDALLWLPDYFQNIEVNEAELGSDCIGYFATEGGGSFVLLYYRDMPGVTLDALYVSFLQNGSNVRQITVNDIPAILQVDSANNLKILTFQTRDNKFYQILFSPVSDDNADLIFDLSIASIRPQSIVEEFLKAFEDEPAPAPVNPVSGLISK